MRKLDEITTSIRASFIANADLQSVYGFAGTDAWSDVFSKVSIETLFTYIVAVAIWVHESIVDAKYNEIVAILEAKNVQSIPWYYNQCLAFQLGDALVFDEVTNSYRYTEINTAKQIVKFASVKTIQREGVTRLQIKISKANKVALTADELYAFKLYMNLRGGAGMHYDITSENPTLIGFNLTIYYNAMILTAQGASLESGEAVVNTAISNYLDGIKYGGVLVLQKLTDALQAVSGVEDLTINGTYIGAGSGEPVTGAQLESTAGVFALNPSALTIQYTRYAY